jgi:hypothetical protein
MYVYARHQCRATHRATVKGPFITGRDARPGRPSGCRRMFQSPPVHSPSSFYPYLPSPAGRRHGQALGFILGSPIRLWSSPKVIERLGFTNGKAWIQYNGKVRLSNEVGSRQRTSSAHLLSLAESSSRLCQAPAACPSSLQCTEHHLGGTATEKTIYCPTRCPCRWNISGIQAEEAACRTNRR